MTDTPDAHVPPSEDAPGGQPPAPAAHAHPTRSGDQAATAVLDSSGAGAPAADAWPSPAAQNGAEPPPFGFNAPTKPEEDEATLAGSPAESSGRVGAVPVPVAEPPGAAADPSAARLPWDRPFTMPTRPSSSTNAPPTAQPRELMPAVVAAPRPRLGETATPTFGPPGRHRSPAAMAVLSVLTLGVYAIAWHRRANQEMGDFDPRIHVHPGRSAWAVFLPWFAGLLVSAAAAGAVLATHFGVDMHLSVGTRQILPAVGALGVVPYLVLFVPFSLIAVVRTAERVRMVEEHAGVTTDAQIRPASVVGWLLFPVVGGLVLMGRQQGHLNRIWDLARE
ncbi:MAG TPA: hypothetical protein VFC09_14180 [Candidatus Dormibacteraeota bacterium]|nr:hypothetical protein [Candidatus Dormibacteraeota bacterium]